MALIGYLILFAVALFLAFMAAWVLLALLARGLSFLILYWMASFTIFIIIGLIYGVTIPLRVLRGKGGAPFRQLTPQDVVNGTAFRAKPRGESRHYGWDRGWPNYVPYQARQDALAIRSECEDLMKRAWHWVARSSASGSGGDGRSTSATAAEKAPAAAGATARSLPGIGRGTVLIPPF